MPPFNQSMKCMFLRFGILVLVSLLLSACQNDDSSPAAQAPQMTEPASSQQAITQKPEPVRAKPDFGGVGKQHIEASAVGPTLDAAIDNAIKLAIEQVNGKVMVGGAAKLNLTGRVTADGQSIDFTSTQYADWLATRTSGVVTNFRVVSQEQVSHLQSTDSERLAASKGESWDKGNFSSSRQSGASYSGNASAHASAQVKHAEAHADLDYDAHAEAEEKVKASAQWDRYQGAQSVDYKNDHKEYLREWQVTVAADIAKYHAGENAQRTRVVVALPRSSQSTFHVGDQVVSASRVAQQIRIELIDALTQTQRFTILDRDASQEMREEISLIESGNARPEDTARLAQQLATDLIVIPTIDRFEYLRHTRKLRLADRNLVSYSGGGALSFRVVNAATGQIVLSQAFKYQLPSTEPTTLGVSADGHALASAMMDALDRRIVSAIMQNTFPLTGLRRDGNKVVINQGGEAVISGATYQAVAIGDEIIDPQSGQSLGPTETPCCTIEIDRVTPKLSYGHIIESDLDFVDPFKPGSLELREQVTQNPVPAPVAHVSKRTKHKQPAAKSEPDEDADW